MIVRDMDTAAREGEVETLADGTEARNAEGACELRAERMGA